LIAHRELDLDGFRIFTSSPRRSQYRWLWVRKKSESHRVSASD
jgi:hypothetical protein